MITAVPGVRVGHWTGEGTGVTVIMLPPGSLGSYEVRGGAPATRETALLDPGRTIERVDAIVLTGGSAFGLAAADGVMRALAEYGHGFPTRGGLVPIVPTAAIYDLVSSDGNPPGPEEGRMALADVARRPADVPLPLGRVGVGTGATIGKWKGAEHAVPGGVGSASALLSDDVVVGAIAVVNALGDVIAADGTVLAGSTAPPDALTFPPPPEPAEGSAPDVDADAHGGDDLTARAPHDAARFEHTTLVALVTNARCTKLECRLLAESAHHGMVRSIHPSHTRHDGDIAFAVSTGEVEGAHFDRLRVLASEVTAEAVRSSVA